MLRPELRFATNSFNQFVFLNSIQDLSEGLKHELPRGFYEISLRWCSVRSFGSEMTNFSPSSLSPIFASMINVSCAIILNEEGQVLVTQRSSTMPLPLKWEFPGGKVEPGETEAEALIREIKEELDVDVQILEQLQSNTHAYSSKTIHLIPFTCHIISGEIRLKEHQAYRWLTAKELLDLDWAEADVPIVKSYLHSKR